MSSESKTERNPENGNDETSSNLKRNPEDGDDETSSNLKRQRTSEGGDASSCTNKTLNMCTLKMRIFLHSDDFVCGEDPFRSKYLNWPQEKKDKLRKYLLLIMQFVDAAGFSNLMALSKIGDVDRPTYGYGNVVDKVDIDSTLSHLQVTSSLRTPRYRIGGACKLHNMFSPLEQNIFLKTGVTTAPVLSVNCTIYRDKTICNITLDPTGVFCAMIATDAICNSSDYPKVICVIVASYLRLSYRGVLN